MPARPGHGPRPSSWPPSDAGRATPSPRPVVTVGWDGRDGRRRTTRPPSAPRSTRCSVVSVTGVSTHRALERSGDRAVDALQLGCRPSGGRPISRMSDAVQHRRLHAADIGHQARSVGRARWPLAAAPTGVATKGISAPRVAPTSSTAPSSAHVGPPPPCVIPTGHAPPRLAAPGPSNHPSAPSRRSVRDAPRSSGSFPVSRSDRHGDPRRRPGTCAAARRGPGRSMCIRIRMQHGVAPSMYSARAHSRHTSRVRLTRRPAPGTSRGVVGGGQATVMSRRARSRCARASRPPIRDGPRATCSAASTSTVVAPRRARTASGMAGC